MNETINVILNRKSVRQYTSAPVEKEKIELLLRAAMSAPSAVDARPWEFVVADDEKVLKELGDALPYAKMLLKSKLAIIVCGNLNKALSGLAQRFWIQDCSAASQNILIAAEALHLGAVWTAVYPDKERMNAVSEILNLPDEIVPLNVIPVGYPAEDSKPKDKFDIENVHFNGWK